MRKVAVVVAVVALALPNLAAAEEPHHPGGKPPPGRPGPGPGPRPAFVPHGGPGPGPHPAVVIRPGGPGPGPGPGRGAFHGHPFTRVHLAPFLYPPGFGYRRWVIGGILPPVFLTSAYFYADYAALGVPPPEPGFQWVRYGPDLLLVNVATGEVVDTIYDAFY
jgi:nickel/cobalt transporter regulator